MDAIMLLCDFAEEINGKLYIMGAGWSHVTTAEPANIAVAIRLGVPWDETNTPIELKVMLMDHDGNAVMAPNDQPVQIVGKFEVGRPPGLRKGTELGVPIAMRFNALPLTPGAYTFQLEINGDPAAHASFEAIGGTLPT